MKKTFILLGIVIPLLALAQMWELGNVNIETDSSLNVGGKLSVTNGLVIEGFGATADYVWVYSYATTGEGNWAATPMILATNANQFGANTTLSIKSSAILTNLLLQAGSVASPSVAARGDSATGINFDGSEGVYIVGDGTALLFAQLGTGIIITNYPLYIETYSERKIYTIYDESTNVFADFKKQDCVLNITNTAIHFAGVTNLPADGITREVTFKIWPGAATPEVSITNSIKQLVAMPLTLTAGKVTEVSFKAYGNVDTNVVFSLAEED